MKTYERVLRRDPCAYCGLVDTTGYGHYIDHVHAKARGGPNHWSNYAAACGFCNPTKLDTPLLEWLLELNFEFPAWVDAYLADAA